MSFSAAISNNQKTIAALSITVGALALAVTAVALAAIILPALFPTAFTAVAIYIAIGGGATSLITFITAIATRCLCPSATAKGASLPKAAANNNDWDSHVLFNTRDQGQVDVMKEILKTTPLSDCPYEHIFIRPLRSSSPSLTFEEDGAFEQYCSGFPDGWDPSKVLFLFMPLDEAKSQQLEKRKDTKTLCCDPTELPSEDFRKVDVKFIPFKEFEEQLLSPDTIHYLFGNPSDN
jgi:hypothetical protein